MPRLVNRLWNGIFGEGLRLRSVERRRARTKPAHSGLSIVRQCALLQMNRSGRYYRPTGKNAATLARMRLIDEAFLKCPYYGSRQRMRPLQRLGHRVRRNRVGRLMRKMGLRAIYQKPNTCAPHSEYRIYHYLLRDLPIVRPNQVWCSDITDIPMRRGFLYLVAVIDWQRRRVLAWRLSNTTDVSFCIEALEEVMARHGRPAIFNTDQGRQFTSLAFTKVLITAAIRISMEGKGRCMDNVFIERLWRSLKYECAYLHAFETGLTLHAGLEQ